MAAETGDNACVPGADDPGAALAIPGSAPAAVLMAAMIIHGVQPGPDDHDAVSRSSSTTWSR
jgi:putative tricarboxylic transport membrane protein